MSSNSHTPVTNRSPQQGTLKSYTTGFILSILLTVAPYYIVVERVLTGGALIASLAAFAVTQLLVQLLFFLHLGRGSGRHWNTTVFLFMVLIVVIVVIGSLWIMKDLSYNMTMSPEQMDEYMREQGKKGF